MKQEKQFLFSERELLGAIAKWATEQSPYYRPDNLEKVLDTMHEKIFNSAGTLPIKDGFFNLTYQEIKGFLKTYLREIPEYLVWNERKNGNKAEYKFTSRYDKEGNPDDDFIDLDALERNITNEIVRIGFEKSIPEILGEEKAIEREHDLSKDCWCHPTVEKP